MIRLDTRDWTEKIDELRAGDKVLLCGEIFTARDAAHRRMVEALDRAQSLPFDIAGRILYYTGPCPAPPGWAVGPAGPTTSGRMDRYTPALLRAGLKGMLGKGRRNREVIDAMVRCGAVYFAATGGAGALLAKRVKKAEIVAYPDLGPEAIFRFVVEDFPAIVAIDRHGVDFYEEGMRTFSTTKHKTILGGK